MEKKEKRMRETIYYISLLDESVEVHASTKPRYRLTDRGVIFITKEDYYKLTNGYDIFLYNYGLKCKISKSEAFWMQKVPKYHTLKNVVQLRVVTWIDDTGNECRKAVDSLNEALGLWKQVRWEGFKNVVIKHETCIENI